MFGEKVIFTKVCPECGTPLIKNEGEAIYYCPNEIGCPPQIKGRIEHFFTRKAMNITCGTETVELLYNTMLNGRRMLSDIADLYTLQWQDVMRLERWAEKSAKNLVESIHNSISVPYPRVLYALGIRYVGETVAKKLAMAFPNIDLLMMASVDDLIQVDEIGERIARSVVGYFGEKKNREVIERLRFWGLQFALSDAIISQQTDKLAGLIIVISGTFEKHSRDEYKAMIEQNGGKNSGAISSKTSYILAGDNMGPAKLEKAEKLGVKLSLIHI